VEDVTDVMTSPFRLWARSGAEQINGQHSTCRRRKLTGSIYAPCQAGKPHDVRRAVKAISML